MPQTVVEKIAQAHMAEGPDRPLRAGDFLSVRPARLMTHDNTSAVLSKFKAIGAPRVADPGQMVFCLDHDIQNTAEDNLAKYRKIEAFAREQGSTSTRPAPASATRSCAAGVRDPRLVRRRLRLPLQHVRRLGALGTPVVRTDAAAVWATGEFWWQVPRTIEVVLEGRLQNGATART